MKRTELKRSSSLSRGSGPACKGKMREYRVVWKREGLGWRRKIYQTRAGAERFAMALEGQMAEATGKDPDAYACCPGTYTDMCGCGGLTNADEWAARHAGVPPLTEGPAIESREVGVWGGASP